MLESFEPFCSISSVAMLEKKQNALLKASKICARCYVYVDCGCPKQRSMVGSRFVPSTVQPVSTSYIARTRGTKEARPENQKKPFQARSNLIKQRM